MTPLGEIFRRYGPAYRQQQGERLSASQRAAMAAIEQCRTEALGGQVYTCPRCATVRYSYHSCRNRHCPTCQQGHAQSWLAAQQALLLPVPYFLVTFTLPPSCGPSPGSTRGGSMGCSSVARRLHCSSWRPIRGSWADRSG